MKKNNLLIVSLGACFMIGAVCGLTSCNMELPPEDTLSPETYFSSELELQLFTNKFYKLMPSPSETNYQMYYEQSEQFVAPSPNREILGTRILSATDGNWNWTTLRSINEYLANSYKCKDIKAKQHYDGVAYFFRAWFYYDKLQRFGEVPWIDQVIESDDVAMLHKKRDTRDVVINHMLSDLDSAAALLPENHTSYEVNRWTALAFKSRVCLFEGTFRKYHAGDKFNPNNLPWQDLLKAGAAAAKEVIQNSGYSLYTETETPYRNLFTSFEAPACEVIWGRLYSSDLQIKNNAQPWSTTRATGFTRRFVNLYQMTDGSAFTSRPGYDTLIYIEECKGRDPRLSQTIHTPGYIPMGDTKVKAVDLKNTLTGYKYIKYCRESMYNSWGGSVVYMPIIRLAEVQLNYAECLAEVGELTDADLAISINPIRDRAGMPHWSVQDANNHPDPYLSKEEGYGFSSPVLAADHFKGAILEIRRERMIELVLEGFHYWDIMRWKEGKIFTKPLYGMYFPREGKYDLTGDGKYNVSLYQDPSQGGGLGVTKLVLGQDVVLSSTTSGYMWAHHGFTFIWNEDKDYLYPIPTQERVMTEGALSQNPGWEDGM